MPLGITTQEYLSMLGNLRQHTNTEVVAAMPPIAATRTKPQKEQKTPSDNEQLVTLFSKGLGAPMSLLTLTSSGNNLIVVDGRNQILCIAEPDCIRLNNSFVNTEIEKTVEEFSTKQKRKIVHMEVDDKYRDRLLASATMAERVPWRVEGDPPLPTGGTGSTIYSAVYFR